MELTTKDTEEILHITLRKAGILPPATAEDVAQLEAVTEECDCCGDVVGLSSAEVTGKQILCSKCKKV